MSEWGIALIAAGSAILGSIVTGWFTRGAGKRQATAAIQAGERQAEALLSTVQETLEEQRRTRVGDARRQAYLQFVSAVDGYAVVIGLPLVQRGANGVEKAQGALQTALSLVELEGPPEVFEAAEQLLEDLLAINVAHIGTSVSQADSARTMFMVSARHALGS